MDEQAVTLTREDSIIALRNDYQELLGAFNPRVVQISREPAPSGTMCLLKVRVIAPTFMVKSESDYTPKSVGELTFFVKVYEGYPRVKPLVYYPSNCRLASVNVFVNGHQCTDEWGDNSSIFSIVEKTVLDIIHNSCVTKYVSQACHELENWQKAMEAKGVFPTLSLKDVYATSAVSLPRQTQKGKGYSSAGNPPPLPGKR